MTNTLRLGVVGCGAVVEALHLPAIAGSNNVELTVIVDWYVDRGPQFATHYNVLCISGLQGY